MTNEEAIKAIKANYPSGGYEDLCEALDMAITALKERKIGKWILWIDCEGKTRTCTCTLCGYETRCWDVPNYCENCGAKMEGAE